MLVHIPMGWSEDIGLKSAMLMLMLREKLMQWLLSQGMGVQGVGCFCVGTC
jgi:hypothetical protein